jgi:Cu(I)/Ag(I) efflux system membrane fusion protein
MDLIPVSDESSGGQDEREISFSEEAVKLMELQTSTVERKFVKAEIRLDGKVAYDETRVEYITAWVDGRIDELYVDFTGTEVNKGEHMAYLYSPKLLSAQEEVLQALKSSRSSSEGSSEFLKRSTKATLEAAREKLRLLGLKPEQIKQIEETGEPTDHLTIYAPSGGTVVDKGVKEGMYVNTGTRIYTIADLSKVWVMLDVYESDLSWIRYGQDVKFTVEAYPGKTFTGKVSFIDPLLESDTRTINVRVNVENPEKKLKPGMFVRALVQPEVAAAGKVMAPDMAGKWICPMHPGVVKEAKGNCDICGMDLVAVESMGYTIPDDTSPPLVIPESAVLITGKRAVVYVEVPDKNKPTFEGREIVLGPKAGDYYIVKEGLEEGDSVVTSGNFKIDSALQIQAKPSMMSPVNNKK